MFTAATLAPPRAHTERTRASMRANDKSTATKINPVVARIETVGVAYPALARERAWLARAPDDVEPLIVVTSWP